MERKCVQAAMSAKCFACFEKFCKYMVEHKVMHQKSVLLIQASGKKKFLKKLILKSLESQRSDKNQLS